MCVKTRFAPSPTGFMHIGNIRTALYAWLYARKNGGKFLLRIEDSDEQRSSSDFAKSILEDMKWLNLDWDEGPYYQRNRMARYKLVIDYMIKHGIAYKCYCSAERLELLRSNQIKNRDKPRYDGYCRFVRTKTMNNVFGMQYPYVIRFCNPTAGKVTFHDKIRGTITVNNTELDDLIICRADGSPTYNFCVVVDDMDMNITHIIRGEEHINNTPRQINILKALNASIPIYAHVSRVLDNDQKKISKRLGKLSIIELRNNGFFPEAILNYLVRLGWSYGNQEIFTVQQMQEYFDFYKINRSPAIFNMKKLLWLNRFYMNHLSHDYVAENFFSYISKQDLDISNGPKLVDIVKLFAKRSYTLKDLAENCFYFYKDFNIFESKIARSTLNKETLILLKLLKKKFNSLIHWKPNTIKCLIKDIVNELNISMSTVGISLRVVLIGADKSPNISDTIYTIGKSRVLERLNNAINYVISMYY
ncbi:glutamate--tRNA ligase [Candidatus Blochmannia ocreatus (nom. nud.)]|uniref:Glutamate--tRNA ligase n=1 Tax=Candidatus Blochmannia ocreatus (nom. nud.) TaxID=251538 RepID=A0ABY4SVF7_9ENTR|nr:glutamate--tRNA ligase [Candidatus Blochmannia ocreatus]URJ24990.1 glutamate--tRNA ligase [Candidatus Blochmannia ocreatus]